MIMPKKSGVIMHFFALFRIYFRINHYIATAKTQLNITAMKKFLIYFCYAAILCSICSCSKDDVQSGVDIEFEPELYVGKYMSIYPIVAENTIGNRPIISHQITYVSPISFDLNPGNYYIYFGESYEGFTVLENRRTKFYFDSRGNGNVYYR